MSSLSIDLLSSAPHYRAHSLPVWDALPDEVRGERIDVDVGSPQFRALRWHRAPDRAVLVASFRDMGRAWHRGYRRIALIEHGIGQSYVGLDHGSYPGGAGREYVSLFLSPNETAAAKDRARYPKARVEVVGSPRLDTVPRRVPDGQITVAVSFHWNWTKLPETRSAFEAYKSALPALAEQFHVIGHAHPRAAEKVAPFYAKHGIEFVADFDDVCRRADVYVAENSSTLYEFASTSRPVVVLNIPEYRRDVEHGLRFWTAASVGVQVDDPARLVDAVDEAGGRDDFSSLTYARGQWPDWDREAALNVVYQPRTNAAAYAVTALLDWLVT